MVEVLEKQNVRTLERSISKKMGRAIADYRMIEDGDRVLVAVSGGKDSLTLFKILAERRSFVPIRYDCLPLHVDLGYGCVHKERLEKFFSQLGHALVFKKIDMLGEGRSRADITCFWCSWSRRKALFDAAREHGCTKIALGHHKDDIVQTILMNILFEGQISAMVPNQELFGGRLSIIRPLAYVEERETEAFAVSCGFPLPHCACPNTETTRRAAVKSFIDSLERSCPGVKTNIFKSLQRVKGDYLL